MEEKIQAHDRLILADQVDRCFGLRRSGGIIRRYLIGGELWRMAGASKLKGRLWLRETIK
jgi:hypothetical protein